MTQNSESNVNRLIVFGTLLSLESLQHTLGVDAQNIFTTSIPVVIRGYKRLYNISPPKYKESSHKLTLPESDIERAAANIQKAIPKDSSHCQCNGLLLQVTDQQLELLCMREIGYQLTTVTPYDFYTDEALEEALIYYTPSTVPYICHDIEKLLPRWQDIYLARTASYQISERFGHYFDETSFLADGKTLVIQVYPKNLF